MFSNVVCSRCVRKRLCVGKGQLFNFIWYFRFIRLGDIIRGSSNTGFFQHREYNINPFPHIDAFWRHCSRRLFENIVTKEEIAHNEHFLLLPQCFPLLVIGYPFNYTCIEIFYFLTKYVQSRLLQKCRKRERIKESYGRISYIPSSIDAFTYQISTTWRMILKHCEKRSN